ncbi:iron chaperone [Pedobacter sp. PWIIR3]
MTTKIETIEEYIASFPQDAQTQMKEVREAIRKAAPDAQERISYAIPTFTLNGNLVHFAAYKNHIGFYPGAAGIAAFKEKLSVYKGAKGSVQFPIDKPMPLDIITEITRFRVEQNLAKPQKKKR